MVLAETLDMPVLDGWSSIGIGLVLVGMAIFLMIETHGLLIGEAADPEVVAAIRELVRGEPGVHHVNEVLTQHLGPDDILVNLSLDMADDLSAGEVERSVARLDRALKARSPKVRRVFIEIQAQEPWPGRRHSRRAPERRRAAVRSPRRRSRRARRAPPRSPPRGRRASSAARSGR